MDRGFESFGFPGSFRSQFVTSDFNSFNLILLMLKWVQFNLNGNYCFVSDEILCKHIFSVEIAMFMLLR